MSREIIASAPGKIILTGEHFVVHGAYAIAAAISKRVRVSISDAPEDSYVISGNTKSKINDDDGQFILTKTILKCVLEEGKFKNHGVTVSISSDIPAGSD